LGAGPLVVIPEAPGTSAGGGTGAGVTCPYEYVNVQESAMTAQRHAKTKNALLPFIGLWILLNPCQRLGLVFCPSHDSRRDPALPPFLLYGCLRVNGLIFLMPGLVSPQLPGAFAVPTAYGDLTAAVRCEQAGE
jgi:hypothetical protein